MQTPGNSGANIAISPTTLGKRKSCVAEAANPAEKASKLNKSQHTTEQQPSPKRLKSAHSAAYTGDLPDMNKGKSVIRPGVVDLTRGPSNFQPHSGAKRLVIKNLRTSSSLKDVDKYYEDTWNGLDAALTSVCSLWKDSCGSEAPPAP